MPAHPRGLVLEGEHGFLAMMKDPASIARLFYMSWRWPIRAFGHGPPRQSRAATGRIICESQKGGKAKC